MRQQSKFETPIVTIAIVTLAGFLFFRFLQVSPAQEKADFPRGANFHWDWHAWQELWGTESLRNANVSETRRKAIAAAIAAQLRPNMKDLEMESEDDLKKAALDTRVKLIDLNSDGVPEIVAQGMVDCGATGNCPFWVFQKTGKVYRLLLESYGQTFTIQRSRTNGYSDIVVSMHGSATQSGLTDYRYADGNYVRKGCYNAESEILEGDHVRTMKEPRTTAFPCSGY